MKCKKKIELQDITQNAKFDANSELWKSFKFSLYLTILTIILRATKSEF